MGEQSYFHRKFYARKLKPSSLEQQERTPEIRQQKEQQQQQQQPDASLHRIELNSNNSQDCDDDEAGPSSKQPKQDQDIESDQNLYAPQVTNTSEQHLSVSSLADNNNNNNQNDHIETLNFHPDTQSIETSEIESETAKRRGKPSRLLKATKAILLFRRATTSLNNVNNTNSINSNSSRDRHRLSSGFRYSRSFVSTFWRQNTGENQSTCGRSRVDSSASSTHRSHPSLTAFLSGATTTTTTTTTVTGGTKRNSSSRDDGPTGNLVASSSSSFSLPRFIVPKMNALKLPIVCLIKSLDDELMREIFIHRYELGQYLIENLKVSLGMRDEKYFGLKMANSLDEQEDVRRPWLDLNESVYKQINKHGLVVTSNAHQIRAGGQLSKDQPLNSTTCATKSVSFYLRIKFYPPNLARVQDQFLKHYLWLQLKRDLRLGKLTSSMNNLTYLMACILQYELGDYNNELVNNKLPSMSILPNQDLIEQQAIEIWQHKLIGTKRHLVLMQFLRASVILETYGFDYYPVRDHQRQRAFLLGFNYAGVKTIRNGRIVNHFRWHNLNKISYERRMIIFHIYPNENSKRKQILGFKCLSNDECQNLYLRLLEQKYFFTVDLTYFDKSIRRPSHLNESSSFVGGGVGGQQPQIEQQQQLATGWPLEQVVTAQQQADFFSSPEDRARRPNHLFAEDDEDADADCEADENELRPPASFNQTRQQQQQQHSSRLDETSKQQTSGPNEEDCDELSKRRLNYQQQRTIPADGSAYRSWHSSADHPSNSCNNDTQQQQQRFDNKRTQAGFVTKSNSLQESSRCDPISYQQSDCFSQPSSPSMTERLTCCVTDLNQIDQSGVPSTFVSSQMPAAAYVCCSGDSRELNSTPQPVNQHINNQYHRHQASLQRQCSFAKYSPDYDNHENVARQCNNFSDQDRRLSARTDVEQAHSRAGCSNTQSRINNQADHNDKHQIGYGGHTISERLVDWTERFLVQPAALFRNPNEWGALGRPVQAGQQTTGYSGNDVLMQGVRLCLLILVLNFLLRLSDGLSSVLIDLLSFEAHESHSSIANKQMSMLDATSSEH